MLKTFLQVCLNGWMGVEGQFCVFFGAQTLKFGSKTQIKFLSCFFTVNGNWGSWGSWKINSGTGQKTRTRPCNNPTPKNGGQYCVGSSTDRLIS